MKKIDTGWKPISIFFCVSTDSISLLIITIWKYINIYYSLKGFTNEKASKNYYHCNQLIRIKLKNRHWLVTKSVAILSDTF